MIAQRRAKLLDNQWLAKLLEYIQVNQGALFLVGKRFIRSSLMLVEMHGPKVDVRRIVQQAGKLMGIVTGSGHLTGVNQPGGNQMVGVYAADYLGNAMGETDKRLAITGCRRLRMNGVLVSQFLGENRRMILNNLNHTFHEG